MPLRVGLFPPAGDARRRGLDLFRRPAALRRRRLVGDRRDEGIEAVFKSVFPIKDFNERAILEYVSYEFEEPKYDVEECIQRDMTYAAPLKVKLRLIVFETDEETGARSVKDIKEQDVYMGDMPLMTQNGTFIVNGTERVVVSQMHRSPGVFFDHDRGKTHSSGKLLFACRIIPYRGSWLDFEFDAKDIVNVRIDRKRKLPVTVLLRAMDAITGFPDGLAAGRTYDYTLPLPAGMKKPPRAVGGADAFLQLIETQIKPAIAAKLAVDPQRQTLWGHSYGGLFVLHTLFTHPTAFQRYIAVEPSLWWGNGIILQEAQQMTERRAAPAARLQLWVGLAERDRAAPPGVKSPAPPADATRLLAEHLAQLDGLTVGYREWPALGHGAMLGAAIEPALGNVIAED